MELLVCQASPRYCINHEILEFCSNLSQLSPEKKLWAQSPSWRQDNDDGHGQIDGHLKIWHLESPSITSINTVLSNQWSPSLSQIPGDERRDVTECQCILFRKRPQKILKVVILIKLSEARRVSRVKLNCNLLSKSVKSVEQLNNSVTRMETNW